MKTRFFVYILLFFVCFAGYAQEKNWTFDEINEAISANPKDPSLYLVRAEIYMNRLGWVEEGFRDLSIMIELEPKNIAAYYDTVRR